MVAAFDYCLHGKGGAAPSIDTAMHGLVDAPHVDHLHPDSGIALATAADGERLTAECFGDRVVWVPWRRPGFQLGLDIAEMHAGPPGRDRGDPGRPRHHGLGRDERRVRGALAGDHRDRRSVSWTTRGRSDPFGPGNPGLPAAARRRAPGPRGCPGAGHPRPGLAPTGRRSGTSPTPRAVLDFLAGAEHPRAGRARHLLPGPLPAHQGAAAGARPAAVGPAARGDRPAGRAARGLPRGLPGVLRAARRRRRRRPCAAPTRRSCWCPGVGMFSFGADKQTARVAGEFYVNAINVMRGAEARLVLRADRRGGEVPDRVLGAGGGQAAPGGPSPSRWPRASPWSPAAGPGSAGPSAERLAAEGACVVVADRDGAGGAEVAAPRSARRTSRWRHRRRDRRGRRRRGGPARRCWPSAASTWWSTTPGCPSPSRCWRPPRRTGTSSTT